MATDCVLPRGGTQINQSITYLAKVAASTGVASRPRGRLAPPPPPPPPPHLQHAYSPPLGHVHALPPPHAQPLPAASTYADGYYSSEQYSDPYYQDPSTSMPLPHHSYAPPPSAAVPYTYGGYQHHGYGGEGVHSTHNHLGDPRQQWHASHDR